MIVPHDHLCDVVVSGPSDLSVDVEESSMQCRLIENREDFSETNKDLCR